jgi:hypothetical protein
MNTNRRQDKLMQLSARIHCFCIKPSFIRMGILALTMGIPKAQCLAESDQPVKIVDSGTTVTALHGYATLCLAICGARGNALDVAVNGRPIDTANLPNSGVMHRDGVRAIETERDFTFDASLFSGGENHIDLITHAKDWTDGVLYDYLRLEISDVILQTDSTK